MRNLQICLIIFFCSIVIVNSQNHYTARVFPKKINDSLPDIVNETSGLCKWNDDIITINDSGNRSFLIQLGVPSGELIRKVIIKDAMNVDWEDLGYDSLHLYIGDIGNNFGLRKKLKIFYVKSELLKDSSVIKAKSHRIKYSYPDQNKRYINVQKNPFDCEAFVVLDSIYLFTKDRTKNTTTVYSLPKQEGKYIANRLYEWEINGIITGAAVNIENDMIALLGYDLKNHFIILGFIKDSFVKLSQYTRIELIDTKRYQMEGICFWDRNRLLISSEGGLHPQSLFEVSLEGITYHR